MVRAVFVAVSHLQAARHEQKQQSWCRVYLTGSEAARKAESVGQKLGGRWGRGGGQIPGPWGAGEVSGGGGAAGLLIGG